MKYMKKKLLLIILIFTALGASAQMKVISLKPLPTDLTAKIHPETDRNNKICALFKIRTPNMDQVTREKLRFKGDAGTEIVKTIFPIGEIWIYLSPQARVLEIKHPDLGIETYTIPIEIEPVKTYEMNLQTAKTTTLIEEVND